MTLSTIHFSSATDEWPTPQAYFDKVSAEFGPFDLDPCATAQSAKCPRFFTKETDGLAQEWTGRVWMNPPYGRTIGVWMKKAYEASLGGGTGSLPRSGAHRHGVVPRLRTQGNRSIHSRTAQVRRPQEQRAIPVRASHLQPQGRI